MFVCSRRPVGDADASSGERSPRRPGDRALAITNFSAPALTSCLFRNIKTKLGQGVSARAPKLAREARALPGIFASQRSPIRCFVMRMNRFLISHVFCALIVSMAHSAPSFDLAAKATNELGVDLHRQLASGSDQNLCISPYSINSALAMTFAGADGETRSEMARVLHFPNGGE